jgi:hypothetical protein
VRQPRSSPSGDLSQIGAQCIDCPVRREVATEGATGEAATTRLAWL